MVKFPDRLSGLIATIEAGKIPAREDLERIALLQALDVAKMGEDFAREAIERDEKMSQLLAPQ